LAASDFAWRTSFGRSKIHRFKPVLAQFSGFSILPVGSLQAVFLRGRRRGDDQARRFRNHHRFRALGDDRDEVGGILTLKGVSREIATPLTPAFFANAHLTP
jgi:hypothetical protein